MKLFVTTILAAILPISAMAFPIYPIEPHLIIETQSSQESILGIWSGDLQTPVGKLTLVVHVDRTSDGKLTGKLDSPDQGAMGIPVSSISFMDGILKFDNVELKASYEGKLSANGKSIEGTFTQGGDLPLNLTKVTKAPAVRKVNHPQEPKPPFSYTQRETLYTNPDGNIKLAGTLTIPKGKGPFPAVVMITGSGPQDRNEELLGHKPFLIIADYFTRHGIAVLRVDDRGVGGSSGSTPNSTTNDFVGDVLSGVKYLKSQKEINPKQIGVVGHSEGGVIGPMAAARSKDVAYVVMMAGTGVPGNEIIAAQSALISRAMGVPEAQIKKSAETSKILIDIVRNTPDVGKAKAEGRKFLEAEYAKFPAETKKALGSKEAWLTGQLNSVFNPWFSYFLKLDPRVALRQVKCPVLAINGSKDLQVPAKQNLPEIRKALKEAGNKDFTVTEMAGLNHLFQHCKSGAPNEYASIEETISPEALALMSKWITLHTTKGH